jgi:hypothetical protein
LDSLESGKVYGFLVENNKWYLAGSLEMFNNMIDNEFRGTNKHKVFITIKNTLIDINEIKWVRVLEAVRL